MFCRSSSHILIWGNCNICFHFLLFPFLFPPPPARTDLQLRQRGECSKKKKTQLLSPPPAPTVTWLHHFWRRVEGVFECREDSNGASSGPWSSSDAVQRDGSVASSELQLKLHRRPRQAGRVRQRQRPKRPSEMRFRSDRAGEPSLMAQHRTVVNTAARPPDDRKQADRSYQDAFASQIAKAAPALICPSYNGFLSWIQCKQDMLFVDRTWMTGSATILTINWLIMETLGRLVSAHSISGNGNQDKYGLSLLPP